MMQKSQLPIIYEKVEERKKMEGKESPSWRDYARAETDSLLCASLCGTGKGGWWKKDEKKANELIALVHKRGIVGHWFWTDEDVAEGKFERTISYYSHGI